MILSNIARLAVATATVTCVSAHPKRTPEEMVEYHQHAACGAEALTKCLDTLELKQLNARVVAKREEFFRHLLKARGIDVQRRGNPALEKWMKVNHDQTENFKGKDIKNPEQLFDFKWSDEPSKKPAVCILTPENVWGPYFTEREEYRQDIREDQKGVYQRVYLQVIDITTCKPLDGARIDLWQANAEGKYAKQLRDYDKDHPQVHWLTGAQRTSAWGTVDFDTIFPGHYAGRAVHTHVSVRPGDRFNDHDGFVHTGQIFYDDATRAIIDKFEPYSKNTEPIVDNLGDGYYTQVAATDKYDPFARFAWLDPNHHDQGLVTWITIGVNSTYHRDNSG